LGAYRPAGPNPTEDPMKGNVIKWLIIGAVVAALAGLAVLLTR